MGASARRGIHSMGGSTRMDAAESFNHEEVEGISLSERDAEILEFERQWWKYAGAKEQAVREKFDMSSTRYYQVLNALIDSPAALAADPLLVRRFRRLRSARTGPRSARRDRESDVSGKGESLWVDRGGC